jgi:hypothetical protein
LLYAEKVGKGFRGFLPPLLKNDLASGVASRKLETTRAMEENPHCPKYLDRCGVTRIRRDNLYN